MLGSVTRLTDRLTESVDRAAPPCHTDGRTDLLTEKNLRNVDLLQLRNAHARIQKFDS